jgi:hypothetical protein
MRVLLIVNHNTASKFLSDFFKDLGWYVYIPPKKITSESYAMDTQKAMELLAHNQYIFIGQTVKYSGSPMFGSLQNVSSKQKIEMPVFENTQLGLSIGMNLEGLKVCSIFPCAT